MWLQCHPSLPPLSHRTNSITGAAIQQNYGGNAPWGNKWAHLRKLLIMVMGEVVVGLATFDCPSEEKRERGVMETCNTRWSQKKEIL